MHDQPKATEAEQEQGPERLRDEHAMSGHDHEDPERLGKDEDEEGE